MSIKKKVAPTLNRNIQQKLNKLETVSSKIRFLDSEGYSRADIARILGKRYQHIKNVLDNPLKQK